MKIKIERAGVADAPSMTPIGMRAFQNDILQTAIFDRSAATSEQRIEEMRYRVGRQISRIQAAGSYWFMAVDTENDRIAGYTGLYAPESSVDTTQAGETAATTEPALPEFFNRELSDELTDKRAKFKKDYFGDRKDFWFIAVMAVDPDYQRLGVGTMLMKANLDLTDRTGQDVYIESTAAGLNTYRRAGFLDLGVIKFLDGDYELTLMLRHGAASAHRRE